MQTTDYVKQAAELLETMGITFTAQLLGDDCPMFCDDARKGNEMGQVNVFPRKSHIHGKHYLCTFRRLHTEGRTARTQSMTIDFWNSYADQEQNYFVGQKTLRFQIDSLPWNMAALVRKYQGKQKTQVTPYDVLACLTKRHPGTLEEMCSDYGYDSDSRTAFQVYESVLLEWGKVSAFFTAEEIEQLQEIN
jgi:hypothetical protein